MPVINSPVSGKTANVLNVEDIMNLLYEDLATLISGADITLRYPEFERTYGEWGAMIKEGRIPAADGHVIDQNTNELCGPYYFDLDMNYYDQWTEKEYSSEIRRVDLTKVLRGEEDYADLLRRIVQRNVEGYRKDVNTAIDATFVQIDTPQSDALLAFGKGAALEPEILGGKLRNRAEILEGENHAAPTFAQVWSAILATSMHMVVENSIFTEGDNVYGASMEDLVIYLPIDFLANSDIKYLQRLYNERGINKLPEIRVHNAAYADSPDGHIEAAFIMDKRVLNHVTRYMAYEENDVRCRRSTDISLHVEDMLKYSPLYKAWAFVFKMPTE